MPATRNPRPATGTCTGYSSCPGLPALAGSPSSPTSRVYHSVCADVCVLPSPALPRAALHGIAWHSMA